MDRRQFMQLGVASLLAWSSPAVFASTSNKPKKFIWVVLRGALDSLHTVVPRNNSDMAQLRPTLYRSIKDQLLPLNSDFGLHPKLAFMHELYKQGQMSPVVAVGSGYGRRSHFQGQDYLESANEAPDNGWLARAIEIKKSKALAVANTVPVSLRGSSLASNWYPSSLKSADNDLYEKLLTMYEEDDKLYSSLSKGLEIKGLLKDVQMHNKSSQFQSLCGSCGKMLNELGDVDIAMLQVGGWDTHNKQATRLDQKLAMLDDGLKTLKESLGDSWNDTVVVVATEFGRTAKENGTAGTDHGTGSALFMLGGGLNGGQVLGQWPGLKTEELFRKRDLAPTTQIFDWVSTLLNQHWQLTPTELDKIFLGKGKLINQRLIT